MGFSKCLLSICFMVSTLIHVSLAKIPRQAFLKPHNAARAEVGVGSIKWNSTLADYARAYACKRILDCKLEHSMGPYGECLAEGFGSLNATDAVNLWVSEKKYYNYTSNSCVGDECRHYTQVIWKNSVHLGCARVKCNNGWMFVTCNYDPPGNYEGERPY